MVSSPARSVDIDLVESLFRSPKRSIPPTPSTSGLDIFLGVFLFLISWRVALEWYIRKFDDYVRVTDKLLVYFFIPVDVEDGEVMCVTHCIFSSSFKFKNLSNVFSVPDKIVRKFDRLCVLTDKGCGIFVHWWCMMCKAWWLSGEAS